MKKKVFGRQFKRDTNERKALFKGLMTDLVMRETIQTTLPKAKSIKGQVEKLVTKAKVRGPQAKQFIQPYVSSQAVDKIITDLAVRFADRAGGYTRIVKLGSRFSDNADMAVIEWVEKAAILDEVVEKVSSAKAKAEKQVVEAEVAAPKAASKASSEKEKKAPEKKSPAKKVKKENK